MIDCFCLDRGGDCCQSTLKLDRRIVKRQSIMFTGTVLPSCRCWTEDVLGFCLSQDNYATSFLSLQTPSSVLYQPQTRRNTHPQLSLLLTKS